MDRSSETRNSPDYQTFYSTDDPMEASRFTMNMRVKVPTFLPLSNQHRRLRRCCRSFGEGLDSTTVTQSRETEPRVGLGKRRRVDPSLAWGSAYSWA